jgi:hypothetical protein
VKAILTTEWHAGGRILLEPMRDRPRERVAPFVRPLQHGDERRMTAAERISAGPDRLAKLDIDSVRRND